MAATSGPQSGYLVSFYIDVSGTLKRFCDGISRDLSIDFDTIDVTSDTGERWKEYIAGLKGFSGNFEGNFVEDSSAGSDLISFKELYDYATAGTAVTVAFTSQVTDNIKFSGLCLINNLSITSPIGDRLTFTCGLLGTGALTVGVVV
jgi:predicted secreted protein